MRLIQAFVNCSRLDSLPPWRNTLLQVFSCLSFIQSPPIFIYALWDVHFPALPETMEMAKKQFFAAKTTLPFCLRKFSILLLSVTGYLSKGAAEQKARSTYEYLIDLAEDPDVLAPLRFLREREVVHFQRFGEALEIARDHLNQKHWFLK